MLTREAVIGKLDGLQERHLIRDVMVKEQIVRLTALLEEDTEERRQKFQRLLQSQLSEFQGIELYIRFRVMSEQEKVQALSAQQQPSTDKGQESAPAEGTQPIQGHGADLHSPLLGASSTVEFIAIASGKGGVGKSTVTVNLAVALARMGKRVGIMDADIYGFSIPDMMGIEEKPEIVGNKVIPVMRHGVKVISMGFFVEDNAPVVWRGPMLGKMLRNFFAEIEWGTLDYMLLDLPPGTGDVALDVHQILPQSKEIIVTTPHATAAFVASRAGAMAIHTQHEIIGVVENMSYYECGECGNKAYVFGRGGGAKLAGELHTPLLAQLPLGAPDNLPTERDYSPSVYKADSETGKLYTEMAEQVIEIINKKSK